MLRQGQSAALSAPCIPQLRLHRHCCPKFRATRSLVPCASSVAAAAAEASVAAPAVAHRVLTAPKDARFNGDCTVFIEEFRIRGNEAGPDQRANIITIANLLQEVGGNHGVAMWGRANSGFAAMPGMDHLIFVATRMQIRMESYPTWGDLVRLETYFAEDGRLTTRRDWRITNADTGEYLGAATSTWVTINAESRRLAKIPENVKQRFLQLAPSPPRCAIPTSDTRRKLPEFVWPPQLTAPAQLGRRSDMDPNGHINNVAYLAWAMEVIPDHVYQQYQLSEVEMDFKAECTAGDQIECFGMPLTDCASSNSSTQQFLHLLRKGGSDTEVWRARTTWKPQVVSQQLSLDEEAGSAASIAAAAAVAATAAPAAAAAVLNGKGGAPADGAIKNGSKAVAAAAGAAVCVGPSLQHSNGASTATCTKAPDCAVTTCSNNHAAEATTTSSR